MAVGEEVMSIMLCFGYLGHGVGRTVRSRFYFHHVVVVVPNIL
jgi:hypothetical protein